MTYDARELARVRNPILLASAAMWLLLLLAGSHALPGSIHCPATSPGQLHFAGSVRMFVAMNPPGGLAAGWAMMLSAMMLPALIAPVRYIRRRSFTHRRARSIVLFFFGYAAVWMALGGVLLALELAAMFLAGDAYPPAACGALIAMAWQFSPLKQRCLNRCHAFPELAAFGVAADWDALAFGVTQGIWCVGSCWALMLLPMLLPRRHMAAMVVVAVLIYCERLEHPRTPRWRWCGFGRTVRFAIAQGRIRLHALRPLAGSS
jgi:predicted metal-binding membrane protein